MRSASKRKPISLKQFEQAIGSSSAVLMERPIAPITNQLGLSSSDEGQVLLARLPHAPKVHGVERFLCRAPDLRGLAKNIFAVHGADEDGKAALVKLVADIEKWMGGLLLRRIGDRRLMAGGVKFTVRPTSYPHGADKFLLWPLSGTMPDLALPARSCRW